MDCSWKVNPSTIEGYIVGKVIFKLFVFELYICFPCSEIVAHNVFKPLKYIYFFNCSEFVLKRFRQRPCQGNINMSQT